MALSRNDVVAAALTISDAQGVSAVSLRSVAAALGLQAMSLYTHVRSKADLLDAMADRILDEVLAGLAPAGPGADWRAWMQDTAGQLRTVLLHHRDGARIVSGARASLRRGDLSELAVTALISAGVGLHEARLQVLAVERFVIGWILEEQAEPPDENAVPPDIDALMTRFPNVTAAIREYFEPGRTVDDLFDDEIRLILRA